MSYINSTIIALSTPPGFGAIAVIRLSGAESISIVKQIIPGNFVFIPNKATFTQVFDNKNHIDDIVLTYFKSPNSYTSEDIVEISCHGSPYIVEKIISLCTKRGASIAQPGEFTKRAFLNSKIDLSQAEGVNSLIHAKTKAAHSSARNLLDGKTGAILKDIKSQLIDAITLLELELDFSEEEIEFTSTKTITNKLNNINALIRPLLLNYYFGKMLKDGVKTGIIGAPNSGKSSLMNAFLQDERVIVSSEPGTTRDSIEESFKRGGIQFRLIDTAGLRTTNNVIENMGIDRSKQTIKHADLLLLLIDSTKPIEAFDKYILNPDKKIIIILNKMDICESKVINTLKQHFNKYNTIVISAKNHTNIHNLADLMVKTVKSGSPNFDEIFITHQRHFDALIKTEKNIDIAIESACNNNPSEFVVTDLRIALNHLDEILGKTTNDDILNNIFQNFCIGK